jgi:lipopolysaccharide export system protein LptC
MLPSRSGRSRFRSALLALILVSVVASVGFAAEKVKREKPKTSPTPAGDLRSIPLPIGHEAKGLVLPNFDPEGHLTAKLEAGTAKRVDENHVVFAGLKLTTFTPENQVDIMVEMQESVFDLETRVVTSTHRATIKRADFDIAGDSVQFDTVARQGKLAGNVHMVITGKHAIGPQDGSADD